MRYVDCQNHGSDAYEGVTSFSTLKTIGALPARMASSIQRTNQEVVKMPMSKFTERDEAVLKGRF